MRAAYPELAVVAAHIVAVAVAPHAVAAVEHTVAVGEVAHTALEAVEVALPDPVPAGTDLGVAYQD